MGRQVKRVAVGWAWPLSKVWSGYEDWDNPTEPPAGDGWQVWETVSEGSPVTPVCLTAEDLARYLSTHGDDGHQKCMERVKGFRARGYNDPMPELPTYEQALAFVLAGWAPSVAVVDGVAHDQYGKVRS